MVRTRADAFMGEALNGRQALEWLKKKGYRGGESDSQLLANALIHHTNFASQVGLIIQDCQDLLENLKDCRVVYKTREN